MEKTPEEKEKISEVIEVVDELPKQEVRSTLTEDEKTRITFVTKDEALTEILRILKDLDKRI